MTDQDCEDCCTGIDDDGFEGSGLCEDCFWDSYSEVGDYYEDDVNWI